MERYLREFDVLRRKAEARVVMRGAFLDSFRFVAHSGRGPFSVRKVAFSGDCSGLLGLPFASKQMRRSLDPWRGPARQDVLAATGMDTQSDEEDSFCEAWLAYRRAKTRGKTPTRKPSSNPKGAGE